VKKTAKLPVLLTGVALTGLCLACYVYEQQGMSMLANTVYDVLLRSTDRRLPSDEIVIVDIDEASLAKLGQWPWPRYVLARLVKRLTERNARVIAFDMVFSEPDRTSPSTARRALRDHGGVAVDRLELADFDAVFAEALATGTTVLGCFLQPTDQPVGKVAPEEDPDYHAVFHTAGAGELADHLVQASAVSVSIPVLSRAATSCGFFNSIPDGDNIIRTVPLAWARGDRRIYPCLALEAVRLSKGISSIGGMLDSNGVTGFRLGDRLVPTDADGRLLINYRRPAATAEPGRFTAYQCLSAADVIDGTDKTPLAGKLVFVGASAPGLRDTRSTPVAEEFSGVEIQATIADNLLSGDFLMEPSWSIGLVASVIVLAGVLVTCLVWAERAWWAFAGALCVGGLSVAGSATIMNRWGMVVDPTYVLLTVVLVYPVLTTLRYWQQERYARWVRGTFGAMVSPSVLSYLEQDPANLRLAGHRTEATVLFADIEGFTAVAEQLDPSALQAMLNRYLTPMADIVMKRQGYVDRFEGDLIMAEWGVPFRVEDHAMRACEAALEQLRAVEDLNPSLQELYGHKISIRIGINTGEVTAGNLGSASRFQYTVVGHHVNIAARLEALNKEHGTSVLIGEETYRRVKDRVEAREIVEVQLRGVAGTHRVYELIGLKDRV